MQYDCHERIWNIGLVVLKHAKLLYNYYAWTRLEKLNTVAIFVRLEDNSNFATINTSGTCKYIAYQ